MKRQQNATTELIRYQNFEELRKELLKINYSKQIIHKTHTQIATGGSGASLEIEDNAGETIADIGKTELTLIAVCDTNDNAYDTKTVTIYYLDSDGVSHSSTATYTEADTTTEAAFDPAVIDFYCFDPAYGTGAVVSSVAVQAGDNVYVGVTGCIADATKRYATILAAATSPTAVNMLGVGSIYGSEAANQDDAGYIATIEYVTPWGQIKTGTWTFAADSSAATRFVSTTHTGQYVNDFYRRRDFSMDHAAIDECRVCNLAKSAIYDAIEIGNSTSTFTRYWVPNSDTVYRAFIGKLQALYTTVSEYCTITITYTREDGAADTLPLKVVGQQPLDVDLCIPIEPNTQVKCMVADDTLAGGTLDFDLQILEVQI